MTDFDRAFAIVVGEEGGYVNNKDDPGGETKYGISKQSYPARDIAALTLDDAKAIYLHDYWTVAKCDLLPWPNCLPVFDCAVNQGVGRATSIYAKCASSGDQFVTQYQAERALHYASLPTFQVFGRGWMRRLIRIARLAV